MRVLNILIIIIFLISLLLDIIIKILFFSCDQFFAHQCMLHQISITVWLSIKCIKHNKNKLTRQKMMCCIKVDEKI